MRGRQQASRKVDVSVLSGISLFSRLDGEHSTIVFGTMKQRRLAAGTLLFKEGDPGEELYVVVSGRVSISVTPEGGEALVLSEIAPGGFFGEMSIIDHAPRSADCRALEKTVLLSLHVSDFDAILEKYPPAAVSILDAMLGITAGRLVRTGAFLSEMVRWGDAARARAVTDPATGLFNRRYLEENADNLLNRARVEGAQLSVVMFDMDRFGSLNREYGLATGDRVILDASSVFRSVFAPTDILVRFGGDEFVFLLVGRGSESAQTVCDALCDAIRHLRLPEYPDLRLSCSLGFASWPDHAATIEDLKAAADRALYLAKERGRDQCRGAGDPELAEGQKVAGEGAAGKEGEADKMKIEDGVKHEMRSIAEKNRTIRNIIAILEERDDFLLVGHQNPDEDCLGAMVAFGLIAGKFGKRSTIATCAPIPDNLRYLLNICRFNSIRVLENCSDSPDGFNTVVAMDTPKPAMLDLPESLSAMMTDPAVLRIEFDHHLEADSSFCGNPGYRLVSDASSTCELVAILAFKIQGDPGLMERLQLEDLFSRNLVLAILTGIIGDSHMGKFLKTPRERWFYRMFSTRFEEMLFEKTHSGGGNYGSKEELFAAISKLSSDEDECFRLFMQDTRSSPHIAWVALPAEKSAELHRRFGHDTLLAVAKTAADILAERSGYISLVSYHDGPSPTDLLQCRMRRSQGFTGLDLRELLTKLAIENGGGHPGAIGFRFPRDQIPDVPAKAAEIVAGVEAMFP